MFWLLFAFIGVPVLEIYLFISIGGEIGVFNTLGVVVLTAIVGAWLTRSQGMAVLARIQQATGEGRVPADELVEGALILLAGAVLLTPGFFTDACGFLLLIPPTRAAFRDKLKTWFAEQAKRGQAGGHMGGSFRVIRFGHFSGQGPGQGPQPQDPQGRVRRDDPDVIDVEYTEDDHKK